MSRRNIRQAVLAQHLNLSQAAVSRRLMGRTAFSVDELLSVAVLLNVPASVLLGEDVAA